MPRKSSRNIEMLGIVAEGLKGLKEEVVFVGGATVDLFITDPAASGTRETDERPSRIAAAPSASGAASYRLTGSLTMPARA